MPLLYAIEGTTPKRALFLGWTAGSVGNAAGFYWIVHTVQEFGELPLVIAVLAYLVMSIANGLGWGVFAAASRYTRQPWWFTAIAFAAVEFGWWSVFPAYFGAGTWKVTALMQVADLVSIIGCSFLMVLLNAAWFESWRTRSWRPAAIGVAVLAAWLGYGALRIAQVSGSIESARKIKIATVQPNIGAGDKRHGGRETVTAYREMSRELESRGDIDLILWPETAYPYHFPVGVRNGAFATGPMTTPMVIGAVTLHARSSDEIRDAAKRDRRLEPREHNSAIALTPDGEITSMSHKIYMVPFGEYLPFGERFPQLYDLIPAISHLTPGREALPLRIGDVKMGALICYEDILPSFTREVVRATDPQLIVNLTNDSWYGDSIEPTIHLALATFRAVEHRRTLIRATNTGISATVDPLGRVTARTGQWTRESLVADVALLEGRKTLYRWTGDVFGWFCVLVVLTAIGKRWRESRRTT